MHLLIHIILLTVQAIMKWINMCRPKITVHITFDVKLKYIKVPVKAILKRENSKHIINVRNVLLKHITETVNC